MNTIKPEDISSVMFVLQEIKSIFTACFEKADEGNFTSIALPVIHATNTSYGETVFVNAVCESLADFNIRYRNSTLREVKIVCEYEVLDISKVCSSGSVGLLAISRVIF